MNRMIVIFAVVLAVLVAGCTTSQQGGGNEQKFCTQDAKLCPGGSAVGRDPDNNCEFFACPDVPITRKYTSNDLEECKVILYQCVPGSTPFTDIDGCGCEATEPRKYVSNDVSACETIRYICEEGMEAFTDLDGCGCRLIGWEDDEEIEEGKKVPVYCSQEQKENIACTKEYVPVCGWSDPEKIQCIKYPCAQTYGNKCEACAAENVLYWTQGECPE